MRTIWGVAIALMLAGPAAAQEGQPSTFAALDGIVVDSLRGGPLRGAAVRIANTSRLAFTDSLGRFRIDSVPTGSHNVELFHDLLDTLGVRVYTPPVEFAPGVTVEIALGVPSTRTIVRAKCQSSASDAGAIFGVVLDAEREEPVPGAEVRLSWVELSVDRETGIRYEPQRRSTTTDDAGRFRLCYLPADLSADISAARGRDSTYAVHVSYGEDAFGLATLFVPAPDTARRDVAVQRALAEASVRGTVVDSAGKPVAGARVELAVSSNAVITDASGTFTLNGVPGTQSLVVRRLGFQPVEVAVNLSRRAPRDIGIRLAAFVPVLEAVLVQARRDAALDRLGITSRRRSGTGRFITMEEIERRNVMRIEDILSRIPGLRRGVEMSDRCITYWVDGTHWQTHPDQFMMPSEIAAMETYTAALAPIEYQRLDGCSVVLIWTKWKLGIR